MPRYKGTMFFEQGASGWSESFYQDALSPDLALSNLRDLQSARLGCANGSTTGTFVRVEDIAQPGVAFLSEVNLSPKNLNAADTPWQSLLVRLVATEGSRRMYLMRGVPDNVIIGGEFLTNPEYTSKLAVFFNQLIVFKYKLKVIKKSNPILNLDSVSSTGLVTTIADHGIAANDVVRFLRTYTSLGTLLTGDYRVLSAPTTKTLQLVNWVGGTTVTTGKIRKFEWDYPDIISRGLRRAAKRNVGRPFGLPLGRRRRR
jgi:hypothetical protein